MIKVSNLTKRYSEEITALDNISFEIREGEICGYIGTNGAGKSTTVKILSGGLDFDSGEVTVSNINVEENPVAVKEITGYVPETANLFNSLKINEFINFIGTVRNLPEKLIKKRLEYFAGYFDYSEYLNDAIGNLSKGNRQKVLITSAVLHNPEILILDEPLSGLDANSIFAFQEMLGILSGKGKTIFYSSHLLDMIEKISTRIIIIEKGKIILDKTADEIRQSADFKSLENLFREMKTGGDSKKFNYEEVFD